MSTSLLCGQEGELFMSGDGTTVYTSEITRANVMHRYSLTLHVAVNKYKHNVPFAI